MAQFEMGPSGEMIRMAAVPIVGRSSWWEYMPAAVHEPFPGAWQRVMPERRESCLAFSAIYACVSLISGDIAKLPIRLVKKTDQGIWEDTESPSFSPVLRKPNRYQTRIQFLAYWVISKLLYGNAYILKERDARGIVTALYPLHPGCVKPLVTDDGDVWYEIAADNLSGVSDDMRVPARAIIHDRMNTLFHPLVGVSPIYACALTVTQGQRIQNNSAAFFQNMSRPSGQLTAPGKIDKETADKLKEQFEREFSGGNVGRLLVTGNGLKYEPMTIPARDAQLIDQLRWTVEDCARVFLMPLHKLGAGNPTVANAAQYNQEYYQNCIQKHIEDIELLIDEGLGLDEKKDGEQYGVWIDEDNLLRMDRKTQAETNEIELRAGYAKPNEARKRVNLGPVAGGDTPYLQQQNYALAALAKRDAQADPFGKSNTPEPSPEEDETDEVEAELRAVARSLPQLVSQEWAHGR